MFACGGNPFQRCISISALSSLHGTGVGTQIGCVCVAHLLPEPRDGGAHLADGVELFVGVVGPHKVSAECVWAVETKHLPDRWLLKLVGRLETCVCVCVCVREREREQEEEEEEEAEAEEEEERKSIIATVNQNI